MHGQGMSKLMKLMLRLFILFLGIFLATGIAVNLYSQVSNCSQVSFNVPTSEQYPCSEAIIDLSTYINPTGGVFSGNGISGQVFIAAIAGDGDHTVTYNYTLGNGDVCQISEIFYVSAPSEIAVIDPSIGHYFCTTDPIQPLTGNYPLSDYSLFTLNFYHNYPPLSTFPPNSFLPELYDSGTYTFVYNHWSPNDGCYSRDTIEMSVYSETEWQDLVKVHTGASETLSFCVGDDPYTLTPWPLGGIYSGTGMVGDQFDPVLAGPGVHEVYYEFTTDGGSCSITDTLSVYVTDEFYAHFSIPSNLCLGSEIEILYDGFPLNEDQVVTWDIEGAEVIQNNADTSLIVMWPSAGDFNVSLHVNSAKSCEIGMMETILTIGGIEVNAGDDQSLIGGIGSTAQLNATLTPLPTDYTASWSSPEQLSCTDCLNPIASPTQPTYYAIEVIDEHGCVAKDSVYIDLVYDKIFRMPTAFSPNGDSKNDVFRPVMTGVVGGYLAIYNRWGRLVFETTDLTTGWNGLVNGELADIGVYVYAAKVEYTDGTNQPYKGHVTVVH